MKQKNIEELLEFPYDDNSSEEYNSETFFTKYGDKKLDTTSKKQILILMEEISNKLNLDDPYSIKRLEVAIHNDIPFFAVNRKLIRNWLLQNFIY